MPATAAIDNETLDHLLSVVDDSRSLRSIRRLSKRGRESRWNLRAISVCASPPLELFAEELRLAQEALSGITGEFTADDLLGAIFSRFCIGK